MVCSTVLLDNDQLHVHTRVALRLECRQATDLKVVVGRCNARAVGCRVVVSPGIALTAPAEPVGVLVEVGGDSLFGGLFGWGVLDVDAKQAATAKGQRVTK